MFYKTVCHILYLYATTKKYRNRLSTLRVNGDFRWNFSLFGELKILHTSNLCEVLTQFMKQMNYNIFKYLDKIWLHIINSYDMLD